MTPRAAQQPVRSCRVFVVYLGASAGSGSCHWRSRVRTITVSSGPRAVWRWPRCSGSGDRSGRPCSRARCFRCSPRAATSLWAAGGGCRIDARGHRRGRAGRTGSRGGTSAFQRPDTIFRVAGIVALVARPQSRRRLHREHGAPRARSLDRPRLSLDDLVAGHARRHPGRRAAGVVVAVDADRARRRPVGARGRGHPRRPSPACRWSSSPACFRPTFRTIRSSFSACRSCSGPRSARAGAPCHCRPRFCVASPRGARCAGLARSCATASRRRWSSCRPTWP